jgi:hypothetical protein
MAIRTKKAQILFVIIISIAIYVVDFERNSAC